MAGLTRSGIGCFIAVPHGNSGRRRVDMKTGRPSRHFDYTDKLQVSMFTGMIEQPTGPVVHNRLLSKSL